MLRRACAGAFGVLAVLFALAAVSLLLQVRAAHSLSLSSSLRLPARRRELCELAEPGGEAVPSQQHLKRQARRCASPSECWSSARAYMLAHVPAAVCPPGHHALGLSSLDMTAENPRKSLSHFACGACGCRVSCFGSECTAQAACANGAALHVVDGPPVTALAVIMSNL